MISLARVCRIATVAVLLTGVAWSARIRYGTFLPYDYIRATADRAGNTYVAGPAPPAQLFSTSDGFVTKISADGQSVVFTTTLKNSVVTGLALDTAGNIYAVGLIREGRSFEATPSAFQKDTGSGFVAKLGPDGSLIYASRLSAQPQAVAADASGAAYVTGIALSDFRTTPGAFKPDIGEARCRAINSSILCNDAFVAKVSSDGSRLLYATFLGGTQNDSGYAIAVDTTGSAYVVGETASSDFPTTSGSFQPKFGGGQITSGTPLTFGDGFAARLDPAGRTLVYSTFLGGSGRDYATGIAVDAAQNAYIVGTTRSRNFPVMAGAFQTAYGGDSGNLMLPSGDAFFVKLKASGEGALATYLGGPLEDGGGRVAIGPENRVYLQVSGSVIRTLAPRPPTRCEPFTTLIAVDRDTGQVLDFAGVRAGGDLAVDGAGIIHMAGEAIIPGDPFLLTPDALFKTGFAFLARIDFSLTDRFIPACALNAASFAIDRQLSGPGVTVAPGEIISVFGIGLGPAQGVAAQPDSRGVLPKELSGTRLRLGDTLLPLLYASDGQVNAIVPYSLTGTVSTLTIESGAFQASYPVTIAPQFPGLFTFDGSGRGPAAVLNQDGTVNSTSNSAGRGSVISFFATGFGRLALPDDAVTSLTPPWPPPAQHFELYIGPVGAEILYKGPAPGLAPGVYQVNARIPHDVRLGNIPVVFVFDPPNSDRTQGVFVFVGPP